METTGSGVSAASMMVKAKRGYRRKAEAGVQELHQCPEAGGVHGRQVKKVLYVAVGQCGVHCNV